MFDSVLIACVVVTWGTEISFASLHNGEGDYAISYISYRGMDV